MLYLENLMKFSTTYTAYEGRKSTYEIEGLKVGQSTGATDSFFENVIKANKERIDKLIDDLAAQFATKSQGTVTITIESSTSAKASQSSNNELSARRIDSAAIYITGNSKVTKIC